MENYMKYFTIVLTAYIALIHIFKIVYLFFKPKFLSEKRFGFPQNKWVILSYYLAVLFVLVGYILYRLEVV